MSCSSIKIMLGKRLCSRTAVSKNNSRKIEDSYTISPGQTQVCYLSFSKNPESVLVSFIGAGIVNFYSS